MHRPSGSPWERKKDMVSVNLIPEAVRLAQARRHRLTRWGISIVVAVVVLAAPLCIDWFRRAQAVALRTQHDQLQIQLATIRTELRALTTQANQASVQLERADALRSKRAWSAMFAMIGRCMPAGCWLTSIATDPATPARGGDRHVALRRRDSTQDEPSTVVIEAPRALRIAGYATNVAEPHEFVTNLKEAGVFTGVVLEHSRREPALDGSYFRFELACEW